MIKLNYLLKSIDWNDENVIHDSGNKDLDTKKQDFWHNIAQFNFIMQYITFFWESLNFGLHIF